MKANQLWQEYASKILKDVDSSSVQYRETKRAFFAGMLSAQSELSKISESEEDRAVQQLVDFTEETIHEIELLAHL